MQTLCSVYEVSPWPQGVTKDQGLEQRNSGHALGSGGAASRGKLELKWPPPTLACLLNLRAL